MVKIEGVWVMNKIILGDHGRCFATSKLLFHAEDVEARGRRKRQSFFLSNRTSPSLITSA